MEDAVEDCRATLGPTFDWMCSLTYIGHALCYLVKFLDLICMLVDFLKDNVIEPVKRSKYMLMFCGISTMTCQYTFNLVFPNLFYY